MTLDEIDSIIAKNILLDYTCNKCKNSGYNRQCTLQSRAKKKITPQGFEWVIPYGSNNTCEKWESNER